MNVPLAFAAAVIGWFVIPRTTDPSLDLRFDWKGGVLVVSALLLLLIAINESYVWGRNLAGDHRECALVRGYQDPTLAAGLRLAIISAALGAVAPFTGRLHTASARRPCCWEE